MTTIKTAQAKANLKISTGGWMRSKIGITLAYAEIDVVVLEETPDSYKVLYPADLPVELAKFCSSDIIAKGDSNFDLTYTVFSATFDPKNVTSGKEATFTVLTITRCDHGLLVDNKTAKILIVDETASFYRLLFDRDFAKKYPQLCREWVAKDATGVTITLAN